MYESKKRTYYPEINYLRGFAILAVISIHISSSFTKIPSINWLTLAYIVIDAVSHFAVPAFIFISGFVLYNKYNSSFDLKQFYLKRYKTIIPPYIIFSTFYILIKYPVAMLLHRTVDIDVTDILHMYITGTSLYHMWFFILIIQLYVLYPLILKVYTYSNNVSLVSAFILSVAFSRYEVTGYLFYFVLGMYLNNHYKNLISHKYSLVFPIFIIGTATQVYGYMDDFFSYEFLTNIHPYFINIITIVYFTVSFLVLLEIAKSLSVSGKLKIIDYLGSYSFAIYLIHVLFIFVFKIIFPKIGFGYDNVLFYPVVFILTLGCSVVSTKIIQSIPSSEYIIGYANYHSGKQDGG